MRLIKHKARTRLPRYVYYCKNCESDFEVRHGLKETFTVCNNCGYEGLLERKPSSILLPKKTNDFEQDSTTGQIVKQAIEEAKQDIQSEKERLKNRKYQK